MYSYFLCLLHPTTRAAMSVRPYLTLIRTSPTHFSCIYHIYTSVLYLSRPLQLDWASYIVLWAQLMISTFQSFLIAYVSSVPIHRLFLHNINTQISPPSMVWTAPCIAADLLRWLALGHGWAKRKSRQLKPASCWWRHGTAAVFCVLLWHVSLFGYNRIRYDKYTHWLSFLVVILHNGKL